jgi:hypothetical protein
MGHTYGSYPVWPFRGQGCGLDWKMGIRLPGARQVATHMRDFLTGHRWWDWEPRQDLILEKGGKKEFLKTAAFNGEELLIYLPRRDSVAVSLACFEKGEALQFSSFKPGDGSYSKAKPLERLSDTLWLHVPRKVEDMVFIINSRTE